MERERAQDFDQELLDLYDAYAHGRLDRREFARRAAIFAVGGVTAEALIQMTKDFIAGAEHLKAHPKSTGKVGAVGFCFGGGMVNTLAVRIPGAIAAAVPFYGRQPRKEDVPKIQAPLLIHYAGLADQRGMARLRGNDSTPATTSRPPSSPGDGRSSSSRGTWADATPYPGAWAAKRPSPPRLTRQKGGQAEWVTLKARSATSG